MPPKQIKKNVNPSPNVKISHFFKKVNKPPPKVMVDSINLDDDEDIIEATPEKQPPKKILVELTNHAGPSHSTLISESNKKRGCYPDDIPDLDVHLPQRKKPCTSRENVQVISLGEISLEGFQIYQDELEKTEPGRSFPLKTPEKPGSPRKGKRNSSGKKKSPMKLFEKSPDKVKDFKVEILHNYVKITPSKRDNKCWLDMKSPTKGKSPATGKEGSPASKIQQSILQYTSPTCSKKSYEAKVANEQTPISNRPSQSGRTPVSGKAKVKLDFTLSHTFTTILPDAASKENIANVKKSPKKSPFKLDELFDDSWDGAFEETGSYSLDLSTPQHCKVLEVSKALNKITIVIQSTKTEEKAICYLAAFWVHTILETNCTVYIQAYSKDNEWWIDNNNGLLVFEPDYLVSSTTLVGGVFCKRKCVLRERFGGFDPRNKIMFIGVLVHNLLQESLKRNLQTEDAISTVAQQLLTSRNSIFTLYDSELSAQEVNDELQRFVPRILTFMQQYLAVNVGKYPSKINREDWRGKINKIQDIEENIWCPELGIKGKVDVSVKVGDSVMPLELKTGRASMSLEHRGQVILYIMMMNKLGYKVNSGLLLYLKEGIVRDISLNYNEKRDLMLMRNELVYYLTRQPILRKSATQGSELSHGDFANIGDIEDLAVSQLPEPINHHRACGTCEYNIICSTYLRKEDYNLEEYTHLRELQPQITGHLSSVHINYFTHWCSLLQLESNMYEGKPVRDIYCKSSEEREKLGRCLSNMQLHGDIIECNGVFSTTFRKDPNDHSNVLAAGFSESNYVIVSTRKRPAVASGIVTHIDFRSITIELDRDLHRKFVNVTFILDTYDSNTVYTFNFTNVSLLLENNDRAAQLRRLIIDKEAPTFKKTLPAFVGRKCPPILKNMNKAQQCAIVKAVAANDYILIKGMPGTGKTATLVALIRLLVESNYSVLVTSHTHSAVDNLCLRLIECGVKLLRLGAASRIHPNLKKYSEDHLTRNCKTPEELNTVYSSVNVIAVTCLGSKHGLLSKRTMDFCIIDESTQVLQCSVMRALYCSKTFILVGDPDQLPPVVRNRTALEQGMSESLFERLQSQTAAVMTLQLNYRMNKTITRLANNLTYGGQLLTANDKVGNANLRIPKFESMSAMYIKNQWVLTALNDELEKAVLVIDTGPVWNHNYHLDWMLQEGGIDTKCVNPSECAVITTLIHALIKGGVSPNNIGVIAPFKAQVAQLAALLQSHGVDVNTVDQFQGKDKEIIFYSCTKSRDISKPKQISKFEILEDKRRLTVAVTRAKHKFILVGDVATIREYSPFGKVFSHIDQDCYLQLIDGQQGFKWEEVVQCNTSSQDTQEVY